MPKPELSLSGCYLYGGSYLTGPYVEKKSGRAQVYIRHNGKKIKQISLARYLMTCHLGYIVPDNLDVDHINGDKTDDRIENLQLLPRGPNARKSHTKGLLWQEIICPKCGNPFFVRGNTLRTNQKNNRKTYCSRSCAASNPRKRGR